MKIYKLVWNMNNMYNGYASINSPIASSGSVAISNSGSLASQMPSVQHEKHFADKSKAEAFNKTLRDAATTLNQLHLFTSYIYDIDVEE